MKITTGTGSTIGTGELSAPMFRHATTDIYRVHYWPEAGGSQGFVKVDGIGWVVDAEDVMPHDIWIALLESVGAPTMNHV